MGDKGSTVAAWNLLGNPIFRRFTRSRLRPKALATWLLVTGILCAFVFLSLWVGGNRGNADHLVTGRVIFIVLVPIQSLLLMLTATGAVATGMMLEDADGGLEYQRLTPLSPLAKIVGYLFGLPVREYCLFAVTVPFTLIAMVVGQVPLGIAAELYVAFFTSAILYHLIGCVAGTLVNRRFAGRIAQMMVIVLYLVLPQLAKLGFEFFSYLTILPVLSEVIGAIALPEFQQFFDGVFGTGSRSVSLFGIEFEALQFLLLIQGTLIVTFGMVLYRKWRQQTHHILGKNFSLGLCAWIHLLLLGSTVPLIDSGEIFPGEPRTRLIARELMRPGGAKLNITSPQEKDPRHAYWLSSAYGLGALVLSCGLVLLVTPNRDEFTKGLRRARKLGRRRVKLNSDGATALPHAVLIGLVGVAAWAIFSTEMFGSKWFSRRFLGDAAPGYSEGLLWAVPFSQMLFVLAFWAVLEWAGRRALLLFVLLVWVVPVLAALVFMLAADQFRPLAILLGAFSAYPSSFYALSVPIEYERSYIDQMRGTFAVAMVVYFLLLVFLFKKVWGRQREIRERVELGDGA